MPLTIQKWTVRKETQNWGVNIHFDSGADMFVPARTLKEANRLADQLATLNRM